MRLRALEAKDIDFFEGLDDEFDKNIDAIHFPGNRDRTRAFIEKEMQQRFGDAFRWVTENLEG
ncbi:MAG: hypothetical protein WD469_12605 [Paenibacillaceae bacterium]